MTALSDRLRGLPFTSRILGGFFALAALITFAVSVSLTAPGGLLDAIWRLNPSAHPWLQSHRPLAPIGFLLISTIMAGASAGCFLSRPWGWTLAVMIFAVHGIIDVVRLVSGALVEGGLGAFVSAVLLAWLMRPSTRRQFNADATRG